MHSPSSSSNQPDEAFRIEGLEAENDIQPCVSRFGFGQAAQHDHRNRETPAP